MTTATRINRSTDAVFQALGDEDGAVLLHVVSGHYHTLNPVGARIWELLETPMSEAELVRQIEDEFHASNENVAQDVRRFLDELVERKLVALDSGG